MQKNSTVHILRFCSQTLVSYEGVIYLKHVPENLEFPLSLHTIDVCDVSIESYGYKPEKRLCIHLMCRVRDIRGRSSAVKGSLRIDQPVHACYGPIEARVKLISADFIQQDQFYICAQILFTQANGPCSVELGAKTCFESRMLPIYPRLNCQMKAIHKGNIPHIHRS